MRFRAAVFVTTLMAVVLFATGACGPNGEDSTNDQKAQPPMTPPTELTVTEAARVAAGYVSMILGNPSIPTPRWRARSAAAPTTR